jgi:Zn-finger nucleic acid-binding protein
VYIVIFLYLQDLRERQHQEFEEQRRMQKQEDERLREKQREEIQKKKKMVTLFFMIYSK